MAGDWRRGQAALESVSRYLARTWARDGVRGTSFRRPSTRGGGRHSRLDGWHRCGAGRRPWAGTRATPRRGRQRALSFGPLAPVRARSAVDGGFTHGRALNVPSRLLGSISANPTHSACSRRRWSSTGALHVRFATADELATVLSSRGASDCACRLERPSWRRGPQWPTSRALIALPQWQGISGRPGLKTGFHPDRPPPERAPTAVNAWRLDRWRRCIASTWTALNYESFELRRVPGGVISPGMRSRWRRCRRGRRACPCWDIEKPRHGRQGTRNDPGRVVLPLRRPGGRHPSVCAKTREEATQ